MTTATKFSALQIDGYNREQLDFIACVQHDYDPDEFYGLQADYREELDALITYE